MTALTPERALTPDRALSALGATWPPASERVSHGFLIREGQGGGSRVSAARPMDGPRDVDGAVQAMRGLGQMPLFQLTPDDSALDGLLAARGYAVLDPVVVLAGACAAITAPRPPVTTFAVWPPLAAQIGLWAEAGIGPARMAVMERVAGPRTSILGRVDESAAGTGFVAVDGDVAVLHALEVSAPFRRRGLGRHMLSAAADWALQQGAGTLALAVTRANAGARALYSSLGMGQVAEYHYRVLSG